MDEITAQLERWADVIEAYRILRQRERLRQMGRLEEKLARVAGVAQRITEHVETRADRVLEREPQLIARSENVFAAKNALLDDAEKALDRVERAMGRLSNDPFQGSGDSLDEPPGVLRQPEPQKTNPEPPQAILGPICANCGGHDLQPIDYQDGPETKHGLRCTTCGKIGAAA